MKVKISLIDVAAECRQRFGDKADYVAGRVLPEYEFRWHIEYGDGGECTFGANYTADMISTIMHKEGWEL